MLRTCTLVAVLVFVPCAADAQISADQWFRGGTFMLTVEGGGIAFTDFHRSQARALGEPQPMADVSRRVSAHTTFSLGAHASYWVVDGLGVRAGLAFAPTSFAVWTHESSLDGMPPLPLGAEEPEYASLSIWIADAAALIRFPGSFGRVAPYGILGGGVVRYDVERDAALPPEARERFASGRRQSVVGLFGAGATIPLQRRNLLLNFELTNHLGRSPLDRVGAEEFDVAGTPFRITPESGSAGDGVRMTSHVRLTVGITLPIR